MASARTAFSEYFWPLVQRDLKVRYAGSALGALWNIIHPLVMILIYLTIFGSIMSDPNNQGRYLGLTYGVNLCTGMIAWLLFSETLMRSVGVLIDNSNFLKKVSFPPLVLHASIFFNAFLVYGLAFLIFLLALVLMGQPVPLQALAGLAIIFWLGLAGAGLGMLLSGMNVFFRDTSQFVAVAMQLLFWFNPIVYPRTRFFKPDTAWDELRPLAKIGYALLRLNPIERYISAAQYCVGASVSAPSAGDWLLLVLFTPACLGIGFFLFRRMLPDARDCL